MNRRELLKLLALGVVGHTLDVDRLLWVPGQKTIFLPTLITPSDSELLALELAKMYGIQDLFNDYVYRNVYLGFSRDDFPRKIPNL